MPPRRATVVAAALALSLLRCAPAQRNGNGPALVPPPNDGAPNAAAAVPLNTSLLPGAVLTASVDLQQALPVLSPALVALAPAIEQPLRLAAGTVARGELARALHLDVSRPVLVSEGSWAGDDDEALRSLVPLTSAQPPATWQAAQTAQQAARERARRPFELTRVVLPSTDPPASARAAGALLLALEGNRALAAPPGMDALVRRTSSAAGISHDAGAVVVDLVRLRGRDASDQQLAEALAALRARAPGAPATEPVALEGSWVRARYSPSLLGRYLFLGPMLEVADGVEQAGGDRDELVRFAIDGLAGRVLMTAGERGAFFDRITLSARGAPGAPSLEMDAELGPGALPGWGDAAAWARSASPEGPAAGFSMSISLPWLRALRLPGEAPVGPPSSDLFAGFLSREGDYFARLAVLPLWLQFELRSLSPGRLALGSLDPYLYERVERLTHLVVRTAHGARALTLALLPDTTSSADAACVLAGAPHGCRTPRLRVGATSRIESVAARLLQAAGRFALVLGLPEDPLQDVTPTVRGDVPPVHIEFETTGLLPEAAQSLLPARMQWDMTLEGRTVRALVQP